MKRWDRRGRAVTVKRRDRWGRAVTVKRWDRRTEARWGWAATENVCQLVKNGMKGGFGQGKE